MELTRISGGNCGRSDCPTVFATEHGSLVVQGYVVDMPVPDGEGMVEIPLAVFEEAVRALGR